MTTEVAPVGSAGRRRCEHRFRDLEPVSVPEDKRAVAGRRRAVADVALDDRQRSEPVLVEHRRKPRPRSLRPAIDHVVTDAGHASVEGMRRVGEDDGRVAVAAADLDQQVRLGGERSLIEPQPLIEEEVAGGVDELPQGRKSLLQPTGSGLARRPACQPRAHSSVSAVSLLGRNKRGSASNFAQYWR